MARLFDNPVHLLILLLVVVLLFGAKRLPDAARGLGRSMRILKSEVQDMKTEDDSRAPRAVEQGSTEPPARSETTPADRRDL